MRIAVIAVMAALVVARSVNAENTRSAHAFESGNSLITVCREGIGNTNVQTIQYFRCTAYMLGIADAMVAGNSVNGYRACFPVGVTVGQIHDVVMENLESHPEERHFAAVGLVAAALQAAFPCDK